jgi:hypothetical protein
MTPTTSLRPSRQPLTDAQKAANRAPMRVTLTVQRDDIYQGYEMAWPKQDATDPGRIDFTHFGTIAEARAFVTVHYDATGWRRIAPGFYHCEVTA